MALLLLYHSPMNAFSRRTSAIVAFFTTLFSVTCLMNGTCPKVAFRKVSEILRRPAMMRVTPIVHRPTYSSRLEAVMFDAAPEKPRLELGLATRVGDFSRGADMRNVQRVRELAADYSMIIPSRLSPVSDVGGISSQLLDHSLTAFLNQDMIKKSFIGRTADTVEKKMKAEVALGGSEPDSVRHNLKFQMKASEAKASMEYRGLTNCDLSYSVNSRKTNLEIFEKLGEASNLVFTHSEQPADRRDVVSLRMHW